MRVKVNLKMLLELLLHPPSPLFYFIFLKKHQVCEMSPGRDSRLGTGRLWRVKGGKVFFSFLEQFGDWAASTEVSY